MIGMEYIIEKMITPKRLAQIAKGMAEANEKIELKPGEMRPFLTFNSDGHKITVATVIMKQEGSKVMFSRSVNSFDITQENLPELIEKIFSK